METHGVRRAQSLKSLSGVQERSWVMPAPSRFERKSVSQLVQHYQSWADLRSILSVEQVSESSVDGPLRRVKSRENVAPLESGKRLILSRSLSLDYLPPREITGTKALCALFESKSTLQQDLSSSPRLNSAAITGSKTGGDYPLQDRRSHNTPVKTKTTQRSTQLDGGRATNGLPEAYNRASRYSQEDKYSPSLTKGGTPATPTRDRTSTSSTVRDRSALYLSRAAAFNSTGGSPQPQDLIDTPGKRTTKSKMAEAARKITVTQSSHDEDNLPPPPPPPVPPRPLEYDGPSESSNFPNPPPKESFSTFYQQRQKSELKRLFKHIHPDLRASLDHAVDDEIMQAVQSDNAQAADTAYQGEVQSVRWIFENWTLDNIGDPHATKKLLYEEELKGGDVKGTSSMFEHTDSSQQMSAKRQTSVSGDVRTSVWLFETKPLDSLNQTVKEEGEVVEAVLKEPIQPGDVRGTRLLFESKPLSDVGRCNSIEDHSLLKLRSELQEQKGDIQKTIKLFQADPCCAIRDNRGNIHEIKSICREEINSSDVSTARWLFETKPLDLINKGTDGVKIIRGISLEEGHKGGVDQKRWVFETQSFDTIQEVVGEENFKGITAEGAGEADVVNKKKLFEMQPLAALKGDSEERSLEKEEIIGGDVKTSLWLFETQPMETLSDSYEVGQLKKITLSAGEQGEVKDKKQIFESCSIQKSTSTKEQEFEKGDVKTFKQLFETIPLSKIAHSNEEKIEEEKAIETGNVQGNRAVFETTPLYAIKDSSGNLHKVTTVSREEFIKGKVQNYKWMFETNPLDELAEGRGNVEVIKGITRQEDKRGDVKMAKWLFETQTIDGIHSKFNQTEQNISVKETHKGDVKTCKWLFETQPMDILYEKSEKVHDKEAIDNTNVKSITWLFESQPLDSIKDGEEYNLKLCSTIQDSVKSEVGVQTVKHLFETETLDRIRKDANTEHDVRCVSKVNFQSGDVSRVKELFESQSLDEIGSEMVTATSDAQNQDGHIEKGSVHTFTWMFENCPMSLINKDNNDGNIAQVSCYKSGDVQNKKFIFETSSLDKIHDQPLERESDSVEQPTSTVDVKSSTMMFESLPLYAIRDKEGQFHEVTTVKKEEVMSGDVRGARWMFETKPLDAIKAENEVYVIRAVTQEDIKKGDVKSARWKFETQPLDSLTSRDEPSVKVTEDFGSSNVQLNKQIFESEQSCNKFVRMVSVTDVQHGDVRTSTWLFENQTIDSLKGEPQEQGTVNTVHRQDSQKGDVKRCTWLFESQPLDKIKESEDTSVQGAEKEIPKADVKCTTWLFETTPLDKITASSVADTLSYLHQLSFVHSSGIIIEANESRNVKMAKYLLETNNVVQIQKEEVVGGNIRNIILQLLLKSSLKPQVCLLREVEKGKVNTTVVELPVYQSATTANLERDQRIQNILQMIDDVLLQDKDLKKGIIMQEAAGAQAEMSVYSLISNCEAKTESPIREKGDVKSTIGNLLATASSQRTAASCKVDENEKGNVNLYKCCIEKGDLHYLKSLHTETSEDEVDHSPLAEGPIDIVQGDVKEAKRNLCQQKQQVERTISDILPGDVKNTKKVFSSECSFSVDSCVPKEEIIPGDVLSAKQLLAVQPPIMVEKEDIVAGDIKATMQSLERAKQQSLSVEREIVTPGTIYDMDLSAEGPEIEGSQSQKEVIISGDVKAAKKSLERAKQQSMHMEREVIVPGKIYNMNVKAQEESSSAVMQSTCTPSSRCLQIKTNPKFQSPAKGMCSACLTPVYPMEEMVANKLILHKNCFCCTHCKKQLSIHNYSSLNGEFYCNSHYQQLCKGKGIYDEGFGNKQHKDQWLQKNKAIDEIDARSTPKTTKSSFSRDSREYSADVLVTKSPRRELGNSGADVKGKLKVTWPPEKKSIGADPAQQTYVKNKVPDTGKAPASSTSLLDNSKLKNNHGGEKKDKMTTPSNSFILEAREKLKTTRNSAENLSSEGKSPKSTPAKAGHSQGKISQIASNFASLSHEKDTPTDQKNGSPIIKPKYNSTSDRLDSYLNKASKSVQFASRDDVARHDLSSQVTTGTKVKELSKQLSDQANQSKVSKSKDLPDVIAKNNFDHLSLQFRKQQRESEVHPEILEHKFHVETSNKSNHEPVKVVSSLEKPQTDKTLLSKGSDKVGESLNAQCFTKTFHSTEKVVKQKESSDIPHVFLKDFESPFESENLSPEHMTAEHVSIQEVSLEKNKNHFDKTDSANDQDNSGGKRKPVERTESLKSSAKPSEKTKGQLGSWSKGKSPLSKLFTSGGNEKSNKTEPREAKKTDVKSGGLLGRLFKSSVEKTEDNTQLAAQDEKNEKTLADDKKTEKIKEEFATEMHKEGSSSKEPTQKQEAGEHEKEKSHSAESDAKIPDVKPSDNLLEGLSQSPFEVLEDPNQLAMQSEIKEKTHDDKKTKKIEEELRGEIQNGDSKSQEPLQKQDVGERANEESHSAETDAKKPEVIPNADLLEGLSQSSFERTEDTEQLTLLNELHETVHADDKNTQKINEVVTKETQKEDGYSQEPPQKQEAGKQTKEKIHADVSTAEIKPEIGLLEELSQSCLEKTEDTEKLAMQDEVKENIHVDDKKTEKIKEELTGQMQRVDSTSEELPQEQDVGELAKEKLHSAETDAKIPDVKPSDNLLEGLSQSPFEVLEDPKQLAMQSEIKETIDIDNKKTEKIKEEVTKETQKEDGQSQEPPQEQDFGENSKEESHSAETDAKKPEVIPNADLLEGLSQSAFENTDDTEQLFLQNELHETVHADDRKTQKINGEVTTVMEKENSMSQEPPQKQDAGGHAKEESHSAEHNTPNSDKSEALNTSREMTDLLESSISEPQDDLTVLVETNASQPDDQKSNVQSTETTSQSMTDPTVTQASLESTDQFIAGKSKDEVLSAQLSENIFGDSGISASTNPFATQMNTAEAAPKPNELLDAPAVEGGDLCSGALFDLNHELPQDSSNPFASPASQEIFVNTPGDIFSSSLSDTALSEVGSAETFGLLVSQPVPTENEVVLGMTDQLIVSDSTLVKQEGDQSSNPFTESSQTSEQGTDFDIFSSNDVFFTPSPAVNVSDKGGADAFTNQPSIFDNDIFGVSDISNSTDMSTMVPSVQDTSNSLNDFLGLNTSSSAAPSFQTDLFADDMFASQPQLLPVSDPGDVNLFMDSFTVSDNNGTQQTAENTVTSSSWMDDLLG